MSDCILLNLISSSINSSYKSSASLFMQAMIKTRCNCQWNIDKRRLSNIHLTKSLMNLEDMNIRWVNWAHDFSLKCSQSWLFWVVSTLRKRWVILFMSESKRLIIDLNSFHHYLHHYYFSSTDCLNHQWEKMMLL